jgi:sporulation-control protein spo0M
MGFTDKMRESLGAEGARIEVTPPAEATAAGQRAKAKVVIVGGTRAAHVEALVVRVVEADRHWVAQDGSTLGEEDAQALADRRHLTAGWTRNPKGEHRIQVGADVEPGGRHEIEVDIEVPSDCKPTSVACSHTLNVQADIRGQIDPTGNARFTVGSA